MSVAFIATAAAAGAVAGLGSVPHCMGMCGPLVAGVCAGPRDGLSYQAGRTVSYGAVGAVSGGIVALGTRPLPAELVSQLTSVAMAAGLLWVALRLVRGAGNAGSPSHSQTGEQAGEDSQTPQDDDGSPDSALDAPRSAQADATLVRLRTKASVAAERERAGSTSGRPRRPSAGTLRWARMARPVLGSPLLVGALSAVLPCAALLNMTVLAAASGTPLAGAVTGIAFATVTGGGLATSAWAGSLLRQTRAGSLVVAGVLVLGAGIVSVRGFPQLLGPVDEGGGAACHSEPLAALPGGRP